MHAINKYMTLMVWCMLSQLGLTGDIEGVFEGAENLHVYKDTSEKNKYVLAQSYSIELKKGGDVIDLFSLNERLVKMGIDIKANELALYDPRTCAVYYRGNEKNFREIQKAISRRNVVENVYILDLKIRFGDNEKKIINLYKGVCMPAKEIAVQGLTVNVACSLGQSNLDISGNLVLPSGNKAVNSSILVGINTDKTVIVKDAKSDCTYEVTLRSIGRLKKNSFFPEDPKTIFSRE